MDAFERNVNIADEKDNQDRKRKQKENVGNWNKNMKISDAGN
jgi:hypothetical protein